MAKKQSPKKNYLQKNISKIKKRRNDFLSLRPHRSFKLTKRRDYKRDWKMPGYIAFTVEVKNVIWSHKWLFTKFIALYSLISFLIVGLLSQDNFDLLNKTINQLGGDVIVGELSGIVQNIAVFAGVFTGTFSQNLTEAQQVYSGLLFLVSWLTIVWLLRQIMAGHKNIKLRDGLYSSGSPLVSTFLMFFVLFVQLIPFAVAIIAYGTAETVDVFGDVLFTTVFWIIELLLVVVSMYWLTSTSIALVVVTLPGMYPLRAIKSSGDLVIGRRLRVLYRLAWLAVTIIVFWAVIILPFILISQISLLKNIPIIPIVVLILSSLSMLWSSAYVYMLYRKLVSDDSKPA